MRGSISINGVAQQVGGASLPVIEVGQNRQGQGVIHVPGQPTQVVPGTSDLESVSCSTAGQCYAVGLAAPDTDEAVLVSITADQVASVTPLPAFIGLYGIDCPAAGTCASRAIVTTAASTARHVRERRPMGPPFG